MISGYDRAGTPEAPVGPRVRIYELAKDLGLQPKDLVAKVRAMAIDVANHMSQIEPADADRIRRAVDRERHESLVEERLNDTGSVIRRRSKSTTTAPARPAATAPAPVAPAPVAPPPVVPAPPPVVAKAEPVETPAPAPAPAPTPVVEVKPEAAPAPAPTPVVEVSAPPPPSAVAPAKPAEPSRPIVRTIPQSVVTGSAATGAFIQLPGVPPRGSEGNAPRVEIKDRDEELRRLGRGGLLNRAPAAGDRFRRPGFGPGGQRPGSFPKKKVAAAGKKLWALGMMGVTINQDIDLDTATLIANEFGYQIESTAFNEEQVLTDTETPDNPEDLVARAPV